MGSEDGDKEDKNTLQSCLLKSLVLIISKRTYSCTPPWSQECPPQPSLAQSSAQYHSGRTHSTDLCLAGSGTCVCVRPSREPLYPSEHNQP